MSVPDHLFEAAQVARALSLAPMDPNGRLGVRHPLGDSLLVQLGLQALVRDGWDSNSELMTAWMDDVKRVMAEGILRTTRGSQPVAKPIRGAKGRNMPSGRYYQR